MVSVTGRVGDRACSAWYRRVGVLAPAVRHLNRDRPAAEPVLLVTALDDDLVDELAAALTRAARLIARKAPCGITLVPDDGREPIVAKHGDPTVAVTGPVGELVLFLYGRQAHARVELDGPDDAVAALSDTSFGL